MLVQNTITGRTAVKIAGSVEAAVASGAASAGDLLPSVRALASHLQVSAATVAAAYRLLQERGVVTAERRRGTRIRAAAPVAAPGEEPLPKGVRDLATGNPDPHFLADRRLYRESLNDPELVRMARKQFAGEGVPGEHIAVVSGALDGIERALREQLRPGDRVLVEDPCFTGVLDLLYALALVPVPVEVDDEGLVPAPLDRALREAKALVVTPRAQNRTGAAITARRARALRALRALHARLARAERAYAGRRAALLRELRARGIAAHGASGLNVWIPVAEEAAVVQALFQRGWAVNAGERYRIASQPAIRVTVAALEPRDARRFANDFAEIVARRATAA